MMTEQMSGQGPLGIEEARIALACKTLFVFLGVIFCCMFWRRVMVECMSERRLRMATKP